MTQEIMSLDVLNTDSLLQIIHFIKTSDVGIHVLVGANGSFVAPKEDYVSDVVPDQGLEEEQIGDGQLSSE